MFGGCTFAGFVEGLLEWHDGCVVLLRQFGDDGLTLLETLILGSYFFVLVILGLYGWHRYYLVYAYMKNKDRAPGPTPPWEGPLPA